MRFQGMDRNGAGRITRDEWRGNDQSFSRHDWNGDGVLSGEEVRPGGRRGGDDDDREPGRFDRLDTNDDGYISRAEWPFDDQLFDRLDQNNDNRVSRGELDVLGREGDWEDRFDLMDENGDDRVSRGEFIGRTGLFDRWTAMTTISSAPRSSGKASRGAAVASAVRTGPSGASTATATAILPSRSGSAGTMTDPG
ncbi:MAG TPA: hypothetical protein VEL74_03470 [Thermoanaerobaculia bacterium]|nr:hypothetical protein [Thermoanaerobaculia bacterium]